MHDRCQPDDQIAYDIGIDKLQTPEQVAWWTNHLADKVWQARSDWDDVVRRTPGPGDDQADAAAPRPQALP